MDGTATAHDRRHTVATALGAKRSEFESFVRARVRPHDVDDVLQLAALRAVEGADSLDDPERVVAWLYRIHRNVIVDVIRTRARERDVFEGLDAAPIVPHEPPSDPCGCSVQLAKGLENPNYASILALVHSDGLQLGEVARRLDLTANNAAVRLHRARKALKREMLEHCGVSNASECADCRCVYDACCDA